MYSKIIGTKIHAAIVITVNVVLLDTASHMVKLATGLRLDGIKNGNNAKPAVKIAPITAKDEPVKLKPALFLPAARTIKIPPKMPIIGAIMVIGYAE